MLQDVTTKGRRRTGSEEKHVVRTGNKQSKQKHVDKTGSDKQKHGVRTGSKGDDVERRAPQRRDDAAAEVNVPRDGLRDVAPRGAKTTGSDGCRQEPPKVHSFYTGEADAHTPHTHTHHTHACTQHTHEHTHKGHTTGAHAHAQHTHHTHTHTNTHTRPSHTWPNQVSLFLSFSERDGFCLRDDVTNQHFRSRGSVTCLIRGTDDALTRRKGDKECV